MACDRDADGNPTALPIAITPPAKGAVAMYFLFTGATGTSWKQLFDSPPSTIHIELGDNQILTPISPRQRPASASHARRQSGPPRFPGVASELVADLVKRRMLAPANPAPYVASKPAVVTPPIKRQAAGLAVVSRFGEISPAFAAAFGASVSIGLPLGARNAEARAFSGAARRSRSPALPTEISTARALPPSRVRTAFVTGPSR